MCNFPWSLCEEGATRREALDLRKPQKRRSCTQLTCWAIEAFVRATASAWSCFGRQALLGGTLTGACRAH